MKKKKSKQIRIVIADDHEVYREGFKSMLKRQNEIVLVGEAENGKELLAILKSLHPNVVVTDIKMPEMDGVAVTKEIVEKFPGTPVIALTMFDDDDLIVDMLEAGAKGYLLKNAHKTEIIEAIRTVYDNKAYYCQHTTIKMAELIAQSKFNRDKKKKPQLTPKEIEVTKLICQGLSNKEMAQMLGLSVRTVEGHREKINSKIAIKSIAELVIYAIRSGIHKI